jgi:hypothetical protein
MARFRDRAVQFEAKATMMDALVVGFLKQPGASLERAILERDLERGSFWNRPQRSRTDLNGRA